MKHVNNINGKTSPDNLKAKSNFENLRSQLKRNISSHVETRQFQSVPTRYVASPKNLIPSFQVCTHSLSLCLSHPI